MDVSNDEPVDPSIEGCATLADVERWLRGKGMSRSEAKALVARTRALVARDETQAEIEAELRRSVALFKGSHHGSQ